MASTGYTVGGQRFQTKEELRKRVSAMLRAYLPGEQVTGSDLSVLLDLLTLHPDSGRKIGCGIQAIFVRDNSTMGFPGNGFWLVRKDGTQTDFSYRVCIHNGLASPRAKLLSACRALASPQTMGFFAAAVQQNPSGKVFCPLEQRYVDISEMEVDHEQPLFTELVDLWLASLGMAVDKVQIMPHGDQEMLDIIADPVLRQSFVAFHQQHAKLRMITGSANRRRKRRTCA